MKDVAPWHKDGRAVFQRIMDKVMCDLQPWCISVYSPSLQRHVADLDAVFVRLEVANLKVSIVKTRLALPEVLVQGNSVGALQIHPHPYQVEAIKMMKSTTFTEELRRFFGAVKLYRRFNPGFLWISNPFF